MMGHMKDFDRRIRQGGADAIAAVGELMPRWIPVTERLPEPGFSVLIFFRPADSDGTPSCIGCDGKGGLITVAALDRIDGQHLWTSEYGDETPTHWMPLPEPPEAK
jgi:hypothetical protein